MSKSSNDVVRRFERRLSEQYINDDELERFVKVAFDEALRDNLDDQGQDAAALLAVDLLKKLAETPRVPKTRNLLHNKIFEVWAETKVPETEIVLATAVLAQPNLFGPDNITKDWRGSIRTAMEDCTDQERLKRLFGKRGNKKLREEALARFVELDDDPMLDFICGCVNALGTNGNTLRVLSTQTISHIKGCAAILEEFWRGRPQFPYYQGFLGAEAIEEAAPGFLRLSWRAASPPSDRPERRQDLHNWLAGAAANCRKWKADAPGKRSFEIKLVIHLYPCGTRAEETSYVARVGELSEVC